MKGLFAGCLPLSLFSILLFTSDVIAEQELPPEPDEDSRLEEIYDQESSMVMFLYSLTILMKP